MTQILTASATATGQPQYRSREGGWTPDVTAAAVFNADELASAELERARNEEFLVCDPYLIEAGPDAQPVALKEQIRASGPTVRFG